MRPSLAIPGVSTAQLANVIRDVLRTDPPRAQPNYEGDSVKAAQIVSDDMRTSKGWRYPRVFTGPLSAGPPPEPRDQDIWYATLVDYFGGQIRWQFQYQVGQTYPWLWVGGPPYLMFDNIGHTNNAINVWQMRQEFYYPVVRAGDYNSRGTARYFQNGAANGSQAWFSTGLNGATQLSTGVPVGFNGYPFDNWSVTSYGHFGAVAVGDKISPAMYTTDVLVSQVAMLEVNPIRIK